MSVYCVPLGNSGGKTRYQASSADLWQPEVTVVCLEADTGSCGWGEVVGLPPYFHRLAPADVRAGIEFVAPVVLGADPRRRRGIMENVHAAMQGQGASKSALDMALWDLVGNVHGVPLVDLWGGRVVEHMPVFAMVDFDHHGEQLQQIAAFRKQGYRQFQIKCGGGRARDEIARIEAICEALLPEERGWFDANRAWNVAQAMEIVSPIRHLAPLLEQPCRSYRECATVSRRAGLGLMLDEGIEDQASLIRAVYDGVMDIAVLKMSTLGGISEVRHLAELGVRLQIPMRLEDLAGTGLTLAAVCHLSQALPARATFGLYDYHHPDVPLVKDPFPVINGRVSVPSQCRPGLGVEVDRPMLGEPVYERTAG